MNDEVTEVNSFDPQMFPDSLLYENKPGCEANKDFGLPYLDILPPSIEHHAKLSDITSNKGRSVKSERAGGFKAMTLGILEDLRPRH